MLENSGPSLLRNLTYIPFQKIHNPTPEFICQKIEAYSNRGNINLINNIDIQKINLFLVLFVIYKEGKLELRRCQIRLAENQTCDWFYQNFLKYGKDLYENATCALCDYDGCNNSSFNYIWIPLLYASILACTLIKLF